MIHEKCGSPRVSVSAGLRGWYESNIFDDRNAFGIEWADRKVECGALWAGGRVGQGNLFDDECSRIWLKRKCFSAHAQIARAKRGDDDRQIFVQPLFDFCIGKA